MGLKGNIYVAECAIEHIDALNGRLIITDRNISDIFYDTSDISIKNNLDEFNLIVNDSDGNFKYNDVIKVTDVNEYTLFNSTIKCLNINFVSDELHDESSIIQIAPIIKDIIIYKSVCMIIFTPVDTKQIRNQYKEFMYMNKHYYYQHFAEVYRYCTYDEKLLVGHSIFATTDKIGSQKEMDEISEIFISINSHIQRKEF